MTLLIGNVIHRLLALLWVDNGYYRTHFNSNLFVEITGFKQID